MRIVFVGAVDFSRHCLDTLLKNHGNVVAVVTISKGKAGRHADYADLSSVAADHGVPVHEVTDINQPENVELIRSWHPDVIFVFGWSQLISRKILDIPPLGCVGTHPTLLPKHRGRHPIVWALVEGLEESGLTFFYLEDTADSGDILWQKPFQISLGDDAGSLYEKIKLLASEAIAEFLPQLEKGNAPRIPQNDALATYWRKRTEKDGEIDWSSSTLVIYNLVRGLTHPYVGAHTNAAGQRIKVWRAVLPSGAKTIEVNGALPGTVLSTSGAGFDVRTGDSYITLSWSDLEGASRLVAGTRLGP